ncbi:MAG: hypothetical protein WA814_03905 [Candidatus Baltobacteraceae bacterium]
MPKRFMIFLAIAALAIAACHSSSSTTPLPSGSPGSPAPNPSIKKATILVTNLGSPVPRVPVEESTPRSKTSPRPGTPFQTKNTGMKGLVRFLDLKPSQTYCWVAHISPGHTSSECAGWAVWQTGTVTLGT